MKLYDYTSDLFLYLVTFRRRTRKNLPVAESEVRGQIRQLLAAAALRAEADPRTAPLWQRAHYALVVFADEVALDAEWPGAQAWGSALLEQEVFGTSVGGVRFFGLLEEVRDGEPDLAEVFFLCLSLGFRGRYAADAPELEAYRRKLVRAIPEQIPPDETKITPGAYHAVHGEAKSSPVVNLVRVAIACAAFVLVYVIFSQVLFHMSVDSIHQMAESIVR
jgi:type IV/VI secretion system ImpK/VasF family protein